MLHDESSAAFPVACWGNKLRKRRQCTDCRVSELAGSSQAGFVMGKCHMVQHLEQLGLTVSVCVYMCVQLLSNCCVITTEFASMYSI